MTWPPPTCSMARARESDRLPDRALDGAIGGGREVLRGISERARLDLEGERQGTHLREELRLAEIDDLPAQVGGAVSRHRREHADHAQPAVGERLLPKEGRRVHSKLCRSALGRHGLGPLGSSQFGTIAARVTWPLSCWMNASLICSSGNLCETRRPHGYLSSVRRMSQGAPQRCSAS